MKRNYYFLISSLRDYTFDSDTKGFDAVALRDEILGELLEEDRLALSEFYTFYDISNVIAAWSGKSAFSPLGMIPRPQFSEAMESGTPLEGPAYIESTLVAYRNKIKEDKFADVDDTIDTSVPFEKWLWGAFYDATAASANEFVRNWYGFDRVLRNICAAVTARRQGREITPELVGDDDITETLCRSSAADFGLRQEVDYLDRLLPILENTNMLEKERRLDLLRWDMADELTAFDYFTADRALAYCVKLNIIHRWLSLDAGFGRQMFDRLMSELVDRTYIDRAVAQSDILSNR